MEKVYVLIEEWNDWGDFVLRTHSDILAASHDLAKLEEYRDEVIESKYQDIMEHYDKKDKSFKWGTDELSFKIEEIKTVG